MFAGKKSAQIREILISESAWEEMTCLFAPSLTFRYVFLNTIVIFLLPTLLYKSDIHSAYCAGAVPNLSAG
ncbi:hypothetical protein MC52_010945 [Klebsiella michiganensis]|nr:hypothetical protein MC52_010945 [Klebsiella michiganensis]